MMADRGDSYSAAATNDPDLRPSSPNFRASLTAGLRGSFIADPIEYVNVPPRTSRFRSSMLRANTAGPLGYIKCILFTAIQAYPLITFVQRLSKYHVHQFVPCNDKPCAYTKIFDSRHLKSTMKSWNDWQEFYAVVQNGHQSTNKYIELSPICPSMSEDQMRSLCRSYETMSRIDNVLGYGPSKIVFEICVCGWVLFKVIHDCSIMTERFSEFTTQAVGLVSLAFQMVSVGAAFAWSMGVAAVFVAPLPDKESCACYYRLPNIESLIAVGYPLVLFAFCCNKLANVHRAAVTGDFLYFKVYDIPYRVAAHSLRDPAGSLMVSTIHGMYALPASAKGEIMPRHRLRCMWSLLHVFYDILLFGLLVVVIAIAIGPTMVKVNALASSLEFVQTFAFALMFCPCLSIFANMKMFFSFVDGIGVKESVMQKSLANRVCTATLAVFEIVVVSFSTYELVYLVLDPSQFQGASCPGACLKCALLGTSCLVLGPVRFVYNIHIMPPFCALAAMARAPYNPSEYLEWAHEYHEFALVEAAEEAADFIKEIEYEGGTSGAPLAGSAWHPRWEKHLQLPEVPRFCHCIGVRFKMLWHGFD